MKTVCLHGAESTGKSMLARKLQVDRGWPWVPEYGRTYCEEHGTDLKMADLLAIAEGQDHANRAAMAGASPLLLLDTDQLVTAAWAQMLFGTVPPSLLGWPKADLYLHFEADVAWQDDGTRLFGEADRRARFAAIALDMLERTGVPYVRIGGSWAEREAQATAAIAALLEA
ncbi:NAD metabolism ATPase/kinase-like protein [Novosphingobium sp. Rr 2-17]|uniref:AAA family ATPase n=1 Tax=Novosphingobium sp. Rr 2-17 TaxID=555793 RepID=UPI0002699521|nr:ATP-binding protein [Novosphingobium sp. Rr 2-17]EIZ79350.1 NAD metabolism ATPase/kinase-like protein [Novosphingobium sp. Rr 2-17]